MSISGLPHLAHFLLRSAKFHQTHLVGRLKLLEKLVEMHCETAAKLKSNGGDVAGNKDDTGNPVNNKRISYRHLCSSLIFARRHVYPPEQPVFPHNLVNEGAMSPQFRRTPSSAASNSANPIGSLLKATRMSAEQHVEGVQVSSFACLMEANIKASRLVSTLSISENQILLLSYSPDKMILEIVTLICLPRKIVSTKRESTIFIEMVDIWGKSRQIYFFFQLTRDRYLNCILYIHLTFIIPL